VNITYIHKERNAVIALPVISRRAQPARLLAALQPLAMESTIPCGPRLASSLAGSAEMQRIYVTGH
jgi:hypothetical protein